jgi:hypothetical protein
MTSITERTATSIQTEARRCEILDIATMVVAGLLLFFAGQTYFHHPVAMTASKGVDDARPADPKDEKAVELTPDEILRQKLKKRVTVKIENHINGLDVVANAAGIEIEKLRWCRGDTYAWFVDIEAGQALRALLRPGGMDWIIKNGKIEFVYSRDTMDKKRYDLSGAVLPSEEILKLLRMRLMASEFAQQDSKLAIEDTALVVTHFPEVQAQVAAWVEQFKAKGKTVIVRYVHPVRKKLEKKISIEFPNQPFPKTLEEFSQLAAVSVVSNLNIPSQEFAAKVFNFKASDMEAATAFGFIMQLAELKNYSYGEDAIHINVEAPKNSELELRVYDVADIMMGIDGKPNAEAEKRFDQEFKPAEEDNGASLQRRGGKLILIQHPTVHAMVEKRLKFWRNEMEIE